MDLSTQRRCLTALAGSLLVGTVGAVAWSLASVDAPVVSSADQPRPSISDTAATPVDSTASLDASLVNAALRGPLYDPPPVVRPTKPAQKPVEHRPPPVQTPKLQMTLIGTIIKSDRSVAIVSDSSGKFDTKGVGETLDLSPAGVTVEKIASDEITLQFNGSMSTFKLDKSTKGVGKANQQRRNNRKRDQ